MGFRSERKIKAHPMHRVERHTDGLQIRETNKSPPDAPRGAAHGWASRSHGEKNKSPPDAPREAAHGWAEFEARENKSRNTGRISVDRSTKATLSTYNTWMQLSRLQRIYRLQYLKLRLTTVPIAAVAVRTKLGRSLSPFM